MFDRRRMKLGMVRTVVLDEVDALLRPPYDQEIDAIMDATPGGTCTDLCPFWEEVCVFACVCFPHTLVKSLFFFVTERDGAG